MNRIEREKHTVTLMIILYRKKKEGNKELCNDCKALEQYAHQRLTACKYGEQKLPAKNAQHTATAKT